MHTAAVTVAIQRFKWHTIVFVIVVYACDMSTSILHGLYFPQDTVTLYAVGFFVLAQFAIATAFVVVALRLFRRLRNGLNLVGERYSVSLRRTMHRLTRRIFVSALGMLLFCLGAALIGSPLFRDRKIMPHIYSLAFAGLEITSIAQITCFVVPKVANSTQISVITRKESKSTLSS